MNRNIIRPAAIGISAGVSVFAALYALVEFDPFDDIEDYLARRRLTPGERAELDRIAAEQAERDQLYRAQREQDEQEREQQAATVAAGFAPELLSTPGMVATAQELTLPQLVAEIIHAEQQFRSGCGPAERYAHCAALFGEWRRRNDYRMRSTLPRVEWLRLDIAREQIETARRQPWPHIAFPTPELDDTTAAASVEGVGNEICG